MIIISPFLTPGLIPRDQPRRAIRNQRGAVGAAGGNKLPPAQAEYDPDKIFKNNPGFDPVFMKVWVEEEKKRVYNVLFSLYFCLIIQ